MWGPPPPRLAYRAALSAVVLHHAPKVHDSFILWQGVFLSTFPERLYFVTPDFLPADGLERASYGSSSAALGQHAHKFNVKHEKIMIFIPRPFKSFLLLLKSSANTMSCDGPFA